MKIRRKRAPGPPGGRWLAALARAGHRAEDRTQHESAFGRCSDHLSDALLAQMGFTDRVMFVQYVEALSRQGGKVRSTVTLPRAKRPPGVLRVVAKRCPRCRGQVGMYCGTCSNWGWGITIYTRRPRQTPQKAAA